MNVETLLRQYAEGDRDFSNAELSSADLKKAKLKLANLDWANLSQKSREEVASWALRKSRG